MINFDGGEYSVPNQFHGEVVGPATTPVRSSSPPSRPAEPARSPATSGPRRVTPAMSTSTSAPPRRRSTAHRALGPTPTPPSWPSATALTVAVRGRRRGHRPAPGQDGRGGDAGRPARRRGGGPGLGQAALTGRFGEGDLASVIASQSSAPTVGWRRADESASLQAGTGAWAGFGR